MTKVAISNRFNGLGRAQMITLITIYHRNGIWDNKDPASASNARGRSWSEDKRVLLSLCKRGLLDCKVSSLTHTRLEITDGGRQIARQAREWFEGGYPALA